MKPNTLRLARPFGKTIWLALILWLVLAGAAEGIARLGFFQSRLTSPKMGSRHYQLGNKLALLETAIKKNGPIDCLMIGSSIVDLGFDPDAFRKGYQEQTGQGIHCFNFGIDASSAASAAALARILIEDYHPRLLIVGTDARDFVVSPEDPDAAVILQTAWVRYRLGDFSLAGWLTEHSYLYRYRQQLSNLVRFNFDGALRSATTTRFEILPNGFSPFTTVATYINDPPNPEDDSFEVTYYTRIFSDYRMLDDNLEALEQIMDQNGLGTQVIIVEMPIADGLYYFFGHGESDHQLFIDRIEELSVAHGVTFWQTESLDLIPDDGWVDYSHVNTKGAAIFSSWLGQQVGKAEIQGLIKLVPIKPRR